MAKLTGDSSRGHALFVSTCARCHGADGAGLVSPALWGPKSFSIGASMAREERAAAFIRHNMPFDGAATLTDQQAFDVRLDDPALIVEPTDEEVAGASNLADWYGVDDEQAKHLRLMLCGDLSLEQWQLSKFK